MEKEYGRTWIWTALDTNSRLLICFMVGDRTLEDCRKFLKELMTKVKNKPLFTSDELPHYKDAILELFHKEVSVEKTGKRGRPKNPIKEIDSEIDYAIVHKMRENGKEKKKYLSKYFLRDMLLSVAYTLLIVILVKLGIIKPIA